jgi:hypothetical protein
MPTVADGKDREGELDDAYVAHIRILNDLYRFVSSDSIAIQYQTIGQYRTEILRKLKGAWYDNH